MFAMRLGLALGKTLQELETTMGDEEFELWIARDKIEALPDSWHQTGTICATVAGAIGGARHSPDDFIPQQTKPVSAKQMLDAWARANNGGN